MWGGKFDEADGEFDENFWEDMRCWDEIDPDIQLSQMNWNTLSRFLFW